MGCPICAAEAPAKYLAHGLTQRELPFFDRFDPEPLTSSNRIPWDPMPPRRNGHEVGSFATKKKNLQKNQKFSS
jgi:hypothetical protein